MVVRLVLVLLLAAAMLSLPGRTATKSESQVSTPERLQKPGWWPRKPTPSRKDYVGPQACSECHSDIAATQRNSAMARTSTPASKSSALQSFALRAQDQRSFAIGSFHYQLLGWSDGFAYSLSAGSQSITEPLEWAFGTEKIGQTYIFQKEGTLHESAFSYFESLHGFARTPALDLVPAPKSVPAPLRAGVGRALETRTAEGCFTCHNTAAMTDGKLDPAHLIPSVTCEACHGPGAKHVSGESSGEEGAEKLIFNPEALSPSDSVDFCGSCHRTWWDVMLTEETGVSTVLAVPYRLVKSRCWGSGDSRLTCVACHDPHRPLVLEAGAYDQRCLACHVGKGSRPTIDHPGSACTVGTKECVTCHMPKYQIQDIYYKFTDHMIRIVRADEAFPD